MHTNKKTRNNKKHSNRSLLPVCQQIMAFAGVNTPPSSDSESPDVKMPEKPGKTEKEDTAPPTAAELKARLERRVPRLNSLGTKYCRYGGKDY